MLISNHLMGMLKKNKDIMKWLKKNRLNIFTFLINSHFYKMMHSLQGNKKLIISKIKFD